MMRIALGVTFMMILSAAIAEAQSPPNSPVPPDSEIRKILVERIDAFHIGVGIVVGVIEPQGRRVVAYGSFDKGDPWPLNGDTIFEIGSVTKVFTSHVTRQRRKKSQTLAGLEELESVPDHRGVIPSNPASGS
jgi:CubicO group peptidase (beta-lactamase class C family)